MIRALKIAGIIVGVLVVVIAATFSWVWWTPSGTRFALARVQGLLPAGYDLGTVQGRLADHLVLHGVKADLGTARVKLDELSMDWLPGQLLRGHLHIVALAGRGVTYRTLPGQASSKSSSTGLPDKVTLPLSVALDRLALTDLAAYTAPDADPVKVHEVAISGVTFAQSRLNVAALKVEAPQISAAADHGALALTAAGSYPLSAHVAWRIEMPGYAPASGRTRLNGSLAKLAIEQHVDAPYHTDLSATVLHLTAGNEPMALSAHLTTRDLELSTVKPTFPAAKVGADIEAHGPIDALAVNGSVRGTDSDQHDFQADVAIKISGEAVTIEKLNVTQPKRRGQFDAEGKIALAQGVDADLSLHWSELRWPLTGEPTVIAPSGKATFRGPLDDYRLSVDTRLEPVSAPATTLTLDGSGTMKSVSLAVSATTADGHAKGHVDARWDPTVSADLRLDANDLDPSMLAASWPGRLNLSLGAAASLNNGRLQVTVSNLHASGRLRGQDLSAAARLRYRQQQPWPSLEIDQLDASLGRTRIQASGRFANHADLHWQIASDDLSALLPDASGRISGSGTVSGTMPRVHVIARVDGQGLSYGGNQVKNVGLTADVDLSGASPSHLDASVTDAAVAGTTVDRLTLTGSGRPADHQFELQANGQPGHLAVALQGHMKEPFGDHPVWDFTLTRGELAYGTLAPWRLRSGGSGSVAPDVLRLGRQCWGADNARVCLEAHKSTNGMGADVALTDLAFGYFAPLLPGGVQASGSVSGSVHLAETDGHAITGQVDLHTTTGQLTLPAADPEVDQTAPVIHLEPSSLTVDLEPSRIRGRVAVNLQHARLHAQAATSAALLARPAGAGPQPSVSDQSLSGQVHLDVPDLAFLSPLLPSMENVKGSLRGDLTVAGTLGAPALQGSVDLRNGAASVPDAGLQVDAVTASIQGHGRQLGLQMSARSGGGDMQVDGDLALPGQAATAQLHVQGKAFQVMNTNEARVMISPDLTVDAKPDRITVNGEVTVPKARISPGARPPAAVTVSQDQVLVSPQGGPASTMQRALYAKVRLVLGDDVHFKGYGLTARIDGNVQVTEQPGTPTTASGELDIVDGEYRAYGQGLVIEKGRVYFAGGPVTQPALDIRAVRHPQEGITVGAHVSGTLQSPSFELFSDPTMSQQEQLSYLVLGRSLDESSNGQQSALSRAALAMGVKGGDFLAKNIGKAVGLDQFSIQTGNGEAGSASNPSEAELVLGKYLSPKLYVSYGIGLFTPESVLQIQYELSRNWKVVTQSSSQATGADLLYTVELGRGAAPGPGAEQGSGTTTQSSGVAEN